MAIPARFQLTPVSTEELEEYSQLCDQIEEGINRGEDVSELLAKWHARTSRTFEPWEFTNYYKSIDQVTFVTQALGATQSFVEDLTYAELYAVLDAVRSASLSEADQTWYLLWLKENLPGGNISDLIYWPNHWFGDQALLHLEMSHDQMLKYAMLRSGRNFADAPDDVELPVPYPAA